MSSSVLDFILIISIVIVSVQCEFCSDKKSRRMRSFDSTRRNIVRTSSTSCSINYFDIESISKLTLNRIENEKSLRALDVSSNRIVTIHNDTFNQFPALEILKLGNNFLDEIRSHYFVGLSELSVLDLSSNLIRNVDETSFLKLESLLWLNIADNCIINLVLNLPLVALDTLNLSHNFIESFPHLKSIRNLHRLDLSHNTNGVLDFNIDSKFSPKEQQSIAEFTKSITSLNAADNELSNLWPVQSFINLVELNLAGNPIDYSSKFFPRLMQLERLNLTATTLPSIEALEGFNARQLTELSIARNPLEADFNYLAKFSNLRHLQFGERHCHDFESFRDIRTNFNDLRQLAIHYDMPDCKCAKKLKRTFSLYHIKFSTDWQHMCSSGRANRVKRFTYTVLLIALQALAGWKAAIKFQ